MAITPGPVRSSVRRLSSRTADFFSAFRYACSSFPASAETKEVAKRRMAPANPKPSAANTYWPSTNVRSNSPSINEPSPLSSRSLQATTLFLATFREDTRHTLLHARYGMVPRTCICLSPVGCGHRSRRRPIIDPVVRRKISNSCEPSDLGITSTIQLEWERREEPWH